MGYRPWSTVQCLTPWVRLGPVCSVEHARSRCGQGWLALGSDAACPYDDIHLRRVACLGPLNCSCKVKYDIVFLLATSVSAEQMFTFHATACAPSVHTHAVELLGIVISKSQATYEARVTLNYSGLGSK